MIDRIHSLLLLLIAATLGLTGCKSVQAPQHGPQFTQPPTVQQNPNPAAPLTAVLTFEADRAVTTTVSIRDGENTWSLAFGEERDPREGLALIGFRPDRKQQIVVTITDGLGNKAVSGPIHYRSTKLPDDPALFPAIQIKTHNADKIEPGFRLLNPRRRVPRGSLPDGEAQRRFGESFGMLLMVDNAGTPVWYYQTDSRIAGFSYRDNGTIMFVTADFRLVEIDLLGNVTRSWYAGQRPQGPAKGSFAVDALTFHHDADILSNGNLLALSTTRRQIDNYYTDDYDANAPRKTQWVMGDRAVEFRSDGKILWDWDAFEHLPVRRIGYETFSGYWERRGFPGAIDWSHANAITKLDNGSVMVNFRYQSAIVNFDPETGDINWVFGEPSGWPAELQSKLIRLEGDARWFWHQHAPVFTERGTLLLFDNNNYRAHALDTPTPVAQTRSRAVEYEIDWKKRTAREVWSSDTANDEPAVSIAMGSASILPQTGNVLVGYGAVLDNEQIDKITWSTRNTIDQITRCVEYTREDPSQAVWELRLLPTGDSPRIGWNLFNCQIISLPEP